jgi:Transglutaminase-like superfamily
MSYNVKTPSPAIAKLSGELVAAAGAGTSAEKARALYAFVQSSIRFGFTRNFDAATPEQTLAARRGHCNPQAGLLASLLNAAGVPARLHFVRLNAGVLHGLSVPGQEVTHGFVEVRLKGDDGDERWVGMDGFILDSGMHEAATRRLRAEGRTVGYGAHVEGRVEWEGRGDVFCQMVDPASQVVRDLGVADCPDEVLQSPENVQRLPWLVQAFFAIPASLMNSRIADIRNAATDCDLKAT